MFTVYTLFIFFHFVFPYAQPTSVLLLVTVNCKCKLMFLSTLKIHFIHTPPTFSHIVITIIVVVINKSSSSSDHQKEKKKKTIYRNMYIVGSSHRKIHRLALFLSVQREHHPFLHINRISVSHTHFVFSSYFFLFFTFHCGICIWFLFFARYFHTYVLNTSPFLE